MFLTHLLAIVGLLLTSFAVAQDAVARPSIAVSDTTDLLRQESRSNDEYRLPDLLDTQGTTPTLQTRERLFVKQIRLDGATVLDPRDVAAAVRPYVNRTVSSAELQTLRVALTRLYLDHGYISSGVLLPDQKVEEGLIVYEAIEGALDRVDLVGGSNLSSGYVAARLQRHIERPLNVTDLQYALRYLEQDPNIRRLDAALRPGERVGESVLRLKIDDEPRFSVGVSADNFRATSTGADRGLVLLSSRNVTGFGEEFIASFGLSEGTNEESAALSVPFLARNATVQLFYSQSNADIVERAFRALDIESKLVSKGIRIRFPFIEELDTQMGAALGFETNRSKTELLGLPFSFSPGAQDGVSKTSVGSLQVDVQWRSASSVTAFNVVYRRGFDVLNATIRDRDFVPVFEDEPDVDPNRTGSDGIFTAFQAQATHIQRMNFIPGLGGLADRAQVVVRAAAQVTPDPLLSLEKFAIGGINTLRGVPESLLVRDNGVATTLELQIPIIGYRPSPHPLNLVVVPFVDYGRSWDQEDTDPGSDVRNTDDARYIVTTGIGALWNPLWGLTAQVYWGVDIANNFHGDDPREFRDQDLQDDGVHYSVSYVTRW